MRVDNALELYVAQVYSWWSWSCYRLKYGPLRAGMHMAEVIAEVGYKPEIRA